MERDVQEVAVIHPFDFCFTYEFPQAFDGGLVLVLENILRTILRCSLHERDSKFHPDETVVSRLNARGAAELWKV